MKPSLRVLLIVAFCTALGALGAALLLWRPSHGDMEVTSDPPGASVFLNQKFEGTTPTTLKRVPAGTHHLRLALRGHHDRAQELVVRRSRDTVHLALKALPPTGTLIVRSDPPGADVWVDGERGPKTPARVPDVLVGERVLEVSKTGYVAHEQKVPVTEGAELSVSVTLVSHMVAYYQDLIAKNPDVAANYAQLGRLYLLGDEVRKALHTVSQGMMALGRTGVAMDKSYRELVQEIVRARLDFSAREWRELLDAARVVVKTSPDPFRACRPICGALSYLGRWQEVLDLADAALSTEKAGAAAVRPLRMEAALMLGKWQTVEEDFDAIASSPGGIELLGRQRSLWSWRNEIVIGDIVWCGAMARVRLNDGKGADAVVQRYRRNGPADYWLNSIRSERWLQDPAQPAPEQFLEARPCEQSPKIDGDLSDPCWESAGRSSRFYQRCTWQPGEMTTTVFATYDRDHLYLAVDLKERDPKHIKSLVRPTDPDRLPTWRDTSIELFLDANRDYVTYSQFMINSNGARWDFDCTTGLFLLSTVPEPARATDYLSAVQVGADGWRIEMALPHKMLGVPPPAAGSAWALNLIRCRSRDDQTRAYLVPNASRSHHQPRCFVLLVFR